MSQPKVFWTTPKKIAITILLALLASALFGCASVSEQAVRFPPRTENNGDTDLDFLKKSYSAYNSGYFNDKLSKNTRISYDLGGLDMADTACDNNGDYCVMRFNPHYVAAPRVANGVMLHEMCHIKTWTKSLEADRPAMQDKSRYDHNKSWRSCMLELDMHDAFREINIDYYTEK